MLVTLMGTNSLYKGILPKSIEGNYWISDNSTGTEVKLLNIEAKNNSWQIVSNNNIHIIDSDCVEIKDNAVALRQGDIKVIKKATLQEYTKLWISFGRSRELYLLYCLPVFDSKFFHLDIKGKSEFTVGKNSNNDIYYKDELVANTHARFVFYNGNWIVENLDTKFGTFVNNKPIGSDSTILSNGDVIFIMGLKIIIMGKSIFINNPQGKLVCDNKIFAVHNDKTEIIPAEDTDSYINTEADKKYFLRTLRIRKKIERESIQIDAPPQIQSKDEIPMIIAMGSSFSMGIIMLISMMSAIDGLTRGESTIKQSIFSILTAFTMLIGMVLFPILSRKYNIKQKEKYEEKRQTRYKNYLNSKNQAIHKIMDKQMKTLLENYPSTEECIQIILEKNNRLWERKIEDYDFLHVRLGNGDIPLDIDINYPKEKFEMEDDNLLDMLNSIVKESKFLKSAPIVTSLVEKNITSIVIEENEKLMKFIQSIIIQLVSFHNYEDLKLVFLLRENEQNNWEYVKMLPHVWDNAKKMRFFADNYEDMKIISQYLEEELHSRIFSQKEGYDSFRPYYLIITDDYEKVEKLGIISELLRLQENKGFSFLCIANNMMQIPNTCKTFINLKNNNEGTLIDSINDSIIQQDFNLDTSVTAFFGNICKSMANTTIKHMGTDSYLLPNVYSFLEMYNVGLIEELKILDRWSKNDSTLSLSAPIGIDEKGLPIALDVHEKFHGPHGLIAGSTGSGKSEFIITYILSLAINFHPDDVNFILIDYKGGGLAGAFERKDATLPHLVGTVTNIDTNDLQRSLTSIQSELRRRQQAFNEVRNKIDEGTIDIYKYQKLYHQGIVDTPIPHLLIICDEFAELKQQQPDFMDELISVSRIGRSLGVHLILATQKPAGIVNDQIRSNSKFSICLKVQDKADSTDVIKIPDAADLKTTGQFYMQVGNNEYFTLGQSAWSGMPYIPTDSVEKKVDTSIEFISNTGATIKEVDDTIQNPVKSKGEQLTNIVRYISKLAKEKNIKTKKLWLDNIPETIYVEDLRKKYHVKNKENQITPVIGEYDDPFNQKQGVVHLDLSSQGNTIIYGNAESGKETLLSTMIFDLITNYTTEEVQLYILDFGSEALKIYGSSAHVGDIIFIKDTEKIDRLFEMLNAEIKKRKSILSAYNGDYQLYLKSNKEPMPMIVITFNNYEAFIENYNYKYDEIFSTLTREGVKYGIVIVLTTGTSNGLKYRLSQNFGQKIVLQLNNDDDYYSTIENIGKQRPSRIFGRGLIKIEPKRICEFQTAKICEPNKYNTYIQEEIKKQNEKNPTKAQPISTMPNRISLQDMLPYVKDITNVPIGLRKKDLKLITYDFTKHFINRIVGTNFSDIALFSLHVLKEIVEIKDIQLGIIDMENVILSDNKSNQENFDLYISNLKDSNKNMIMFILGVDKFISKYSDTQSRFYESLKKAKECGNCNFVLVEAENKMKGYEYEQWYDEYVSKNNGIWIGNGIDNQYSISILSDRRSLVNNCGRSYGYFVNNEKPTLIKLIGLKEEGEEDE